MKRFEIQEMVSQSKQGVAYLAYDKETQRNAALRRFFPFGQDGGELGDQQKGDYIQTCERLSRITHTNLRFVIDGGVDPSDGTPYLATEWVEGNPLGQILAGSPLDPARTIDIVRCALEVSLELSEAFGQQAVWVETNLNSIVVGNVESDRGYTFWVCPQRWFNVAPKLREVSSLALLAEELIGWNTRIYSKEAGGGFGGWVKAMKSASAISVEEALNQLNHLLGKHQPKSGTTASTLSQPVALATSTAKPASGATTKSTPSTPKPVPKRHPKPTPKPVARPVARTAVAMNTAQATQPVRASMGGGVGRSPTAMPNSGGKSKGIIGALMFISACLALTAGLIFMVQKNRAELRDQLAKNEAIANAEEEAKKGATGVSNERRTPSPRPLVVGSSSPGNSASPSVSAPNAVGAIFSPKDNVVARQLPEGSVIKAKGTLEQIKIKESANGKYAELLFVESTSIQGRASVDFEGEVREELFKPYIGREIIIEGPSTFGAGRRNTVSIGIKSLKQIRVAGDGPSTNQQPKPEPPPPVAGPEPPPTESGVPTFSPEQTEKIRKYGSGKPAKLKGRLMEVGGNPRKDIVLRFVKPSKRHSYIYGRAEAKGFKGNFSPDLFRQYVGKQIVIEGTYSYKPNWGMNAHTVEFIRPSQVRLVEE